MSAHPERGHHVFNEEEVRDFRARWDQVQTSFIDQPRHAVELSDSLVATVIRRIPEQFIPEQFAEERARLQQPWAHDNNASTEDLRQNFQRYRIFFDRLLAS